MVHESVEKLILRTVTGDAAVLAGHADLVAALGRGTMIIVADGVRHKGLCEGGMLSVTGGEATIASRSICWEKEMPCHDL